MFHLPFDCSEAAFDRFRADVEAFEAEMPDRVAAVLDRVESPVARRRVERVAFQSSEALPKRRERPGTVSTLAAYAVAQLATAHDLPGERRDRLVELALAVTEYADAVDDMVDGDVHPDHETDVLLALQALWPAIVAILADLGRAETAYWADGAAGLVGAPFEERDRAVDRENYRAIVDRQSRLFGTLTGLTAVAAGHDPDAGDRGDPDDVATDRTDGADDPTERAEETDATNGAGDGADDRAVERAEQIGALFFRYTQYLLDCEQYDGGREWNALAVASPEAVLSSLREWRRAFEAELDGLPDEQADRLRPMVAVDLDALADRIRDGDADAD